MRWPSVASSLASINSVAVLPVTEKDHSESINDLHGFMSQALPQAAQDSLGAYLSTDRFDRRTDDDRTLVISVWTGDAA